MFNLTMTQAIRICLVKKELDIGTVVPCLESIQFRGHGEIFLIPEEFQPLSYHPAIAGRSRVIKVLEKMRAVNVYRYMTIVLTEEQKSHYVDRNWNFGLSRQTLGPKNHVVRIFPIPSRDLKTEISSGKSKVLSKILSAVSRWTSAQGVLLNDSRRILLYIIISIVAIKGLCWMSALVSKQRREIHRLDTQISRLRYDRHRLDNEISQLRYDRHRLDTEISSLRSEVHEPTKISFIWRIPNITEKLHGVRPWKENVLRSEPFFTSRNGYKLRAQLHLCDFLDSDHLTVFIEVLPGEFDPILRWLFGLKGSLTLIDQAENPDEAIHITDPEKPVAWPCHRPVEGSELFCMEMPRFASHDTLRSRDYVKNDTIFLKIEIEEKVIWPFSDYVDDE